MSAVIRVESLNKTFGRKQALFDLALSVEPGEMVALIGASGSGKSTLLRHVAGLACCDRNGGGSVQVLGCVGRMPCWRGSFGLFNAEEKQRALQALARVGLADLAQQRASTLSGGQQQRVAIARALCQRAKVILADEPIASLDPESARKVMQILADINREDGTTVVVTLHKVDYAMRYCQRAVALKAGRIHYDGAAAELHANFLNDLYGAELLDEPQTAEKPRRARKPKVPLALAKA